MKDESILMKKIKVEDGEFYFGHLLFAVNHIGNIKLSAFKTIDEKIDFLKYVALTINAITSHKNQKQACQNLWNYINKERKKDHRITKEILKEWDAKLGDNIFHYYERKERKFVPKKTIKLQKQYLLSLCLLLKELRYKIKEYEYVEIRGIFYSSLLENFKQSSEYGFVPVISQKNLAQVKVFYEYYPELVNLPVSEQCSSKFLFNVLIEMWKITKNEKYLKSLDLNFDILKNSEYSSVVSEIYDKIIKIVKENKELENCIPKIMGFKNVESKIVFEEEDVFQLKIDMQVIQKVMLESSITVNKITPEICENNLKVLMSYELEGLLLIKPLKKIYISKDKRAIEFIFVKKNVDNMELFKTMWKKIISEMLINESYDVKILTLETLNEEYEMRKNLKKSNSYQKVIKY